MPLGAAPSPPASRFPASSSPCAQRGSASRGGRSPYTEAGSAQPFHSERTGLHPWLRSEPRNAGPEARPFNSRASGSHLHGQGALPHLNSDTLAPSPDRPRAPATRGRWKPCSHSLFWSNRDLSGSLPALRTQPSSFLQLQLWVPSGLNVGLPQLPSSHPSSLTLVCP